MRSIYSAEDDIPNAEQIRTILKDLRETRQAKSRTGLAGLDDKWLMVSFFLEIEQDGSKSFFFK